MLLQGVDDHGWGATFDQITGCRSGGVYLLSGGGTARNPPRHALTLSAAPVTSVATNGQIQLSLPEAALSEDVAFVISRAADSQYQTIQSTPFCTVPAAPPSGACDTGSAI